jgi:AcrR family transcriptional regulator
MYAIIIDYSQSTDQPVQPANGLESEKTAPSPTLTRVERKRRDTRARIIAGAEQLMGECPVDEITIQYITEAADVGHGTFYLHFKSKYEVLVPIIAKRAEIWDARVQRSCGTLEDPAEIMAFSARHMARVVLKDPLWRWFLEHSGVPVEDMRVAIGTFGARDFGKGLISGRFRVPDLAISTSFLFGAYVNTLLTCLNLDEPGEALDQMVEMMLRVIGVSPGEAAEIAHRPLAPLAE